MYEQIVYDVDDPVATITLNRPRQLNAWTERMAAEVKHALARAENDRRVVGIVLTGSGRGFSAGADLNVLEGLSRGEREEAVPEELEADPGDPHMGASFRGTYTYLLSIRKPILAALNGAVAGMALPITLCCDLRFASEGAFFLTAFAERGLIAEWGSSWLLPRVVGLPNALDLLFSARRIDATEALRIGLVHRVVPSDDLLPATRAYVQDLAARCSPTSLAIMKRQIYQHLTTSLERAEREAFTLMLESFQRPDFREGVTAFLEKRPPRFERL